MLTSMVYAGCSLVFSNYLYQYITNKDYAVAAERSFFQVVAILVVYAAL